MSEEVKESTNGGSEYDLGCGTLYLNEREKPLVFILWGKNAIEKKKYIDSRHLVLTSVHPSPLSAYRGFFGSRPFSKTNEFLIKNGMTPIDWSIPNV